MRALDLAKRLLAASAILFFGAIAISVMTRDEWLALAHAASLVSALIAALGVLLLIAAGLRRWAAVRSVGAAVAGPCDHELGQTGWDTAAAGAQPGQTPEDDDRTITSVHDIMSRQR